MRYSRLSGWLGAAVLSALALRTGADVPLVKHGDAWSYLKGTNTPQADWKTVADAGLEGSWLAGHGGFGYANNSGELALVQTVLGDMKDRYTRVPSSHGA